MQLSTLVNYVPNVQPADGLACRREAASKIISHVQKCDGHACRQAPASREGIPGGTVLASAVLLFLSACKLKLRSPGF